MQGIQAEKTTIKNQAISVILRTESRLEREAAQKNWVLNRVVL